MSTSRQKCGVSAIRLLLNIRNNLCKLCFSSKLNFHGNFQHAGLPCFSYFFYKMKTIVLLFFKWKNLLLLHFEIKSKTSKVLISCLCYLFLLKRKWKNCYFFSFEDKEKYPKVVASFCKEIKAFFHFLKKGNKSTATSFL